ncbi:MAG: hypothetical protein CVT92_04895 [Bacteroidetes bacterium HGW-Bacteroidetes-1]|jgi:signal transduction histidine kinase|nr:MAG: hypothetical protein CVT92_04895 [Bacteroidetes bacterium HGW-Bacteroidetes-1]
MRTKFSIVVGLSLVLAVVLSSCNNKNEDVYVKTDWVSQYTLDKTIVEVNTTNAATGFETLFQSIITDSAQQAILCQSFIQPVRFFDDASGYYFVETYRAWMVAHATNPGLIGTNRLDIQDVNGKYYVRDMVNTAIYTGNGFIEYYFSNPATSLTERKIGFVKSIPSAQLFIGSGFYGDPLSFYYTPNEAKIKIAEEATRSMALGMGGALSGYYSDTANRVEFCRKMIDFVRFFDDQSGYFFMYDFNCVNLAHGTQKELQGQKLYDYQDSRGNYVIRELVSVAKNVEGSGFYEYWWNNPVTGKEEPKLAFVMKIPGFDYFIGSGIYLQ